ncbi:hypothetical protein EVAR_84093_1 [Eumeta japonica]|uniref:Uncharacterized protein n=1 Tax=Eumeta variegata TaxID=151549 RepID=A0A4C1V055_EUMVA|nr:hypothetical protein EVAR_84093_1 [Eumeta japonica]
MAWRAGRANANVLSENAITPRVPGRAAGGEGRPSSGCCRGLLLVSTYWHASWLGEAPSLASYVVARRSLLRRVASAPSAFEESL